MKKSILKIKDIVIEKKIYPREKINKKTVNEYVVAMKNGETFPPLFVGFFKRKNYLVDGVHRLEAYKRMGEEYVQCEVKINFPSIEDIYLASIRYNSKHGLRFTDKDKIKIAFTLKDMHYDIGDISELTGLDTKKLESSISNKMTHVLIKDKLKSGEIPEIIKDKIPVKENIKIIDDKEIKKLEIANKEEFQIYQLNEIYDYLKKEEFDLDNKNIGSLLKNIKKILHKKFPKL